MKRFLLLTLISTSVLGQGLQVPPLQLRNGVRVDSQPFSPRSNLSLGLEASSNADKFNQAQRLCSAILAHLDSSAFTPEQILNLVRTRNSDILISNYNDVDIRAWITSYRVNQNVSPGSNTLTPETECLTRARNWLPRDVQDAIMVSASTPDLTVQPVRQQTACDGISDAQLEEFCKTETALIEDASSLQNIQAALQSTFSLPNQTPRCNCLRERVRRAFPNEQDRADQIRNAKKNLDDLIVQHAGRRFIDRLASNEEDLNFMSMLPSGDENERFSNASCINPQQFSTLLGNNCNVSQENRQRRLSLIFNSFGHYSNATTIEGLLQDFSVRLNNVNVPGRAEPVTRDQFDVRRISIADTDPKVQMIEGMLSGMLSDAAVRGRIEAFTKSNPRNRPKDTILHVLREDIENGNRLPSYLNINGLPEESKRELTQLISSGDSRGLSNKIYQHLRYATVLHPGLDRMIENQNVFSEIVDGYRNGAHSQRLFERLRQSTTIRSQFDNDCNTYRNHLKELVCTPPEELLKRVPGQDLQTIVNYNSPSSQLLELNSAILCDNPRASPLDSLRHIYNEGYNPELHSDFREHVNPSGMQTPLKRLMLAEQVSEDIQNEVGEAVITYESKNRGWADDVGGNRFFGDRGGRISDELITETRKGNFSSELVERVQNSQVASSQIASTTQTQISQNLSSNEERETSTNVFDQNTSSSGAAVAQTNFSNVPTSAGNYVSNGTAVSSGRSANDLPDFDRNPFEYDPSEIENLRSNLNADQLAELEELRKQAERDRDKLLALTGETQKARIKALQEQLRSLESRRNVSSTDEAEEDLSQDNVARNSNFSQFQNISQQVERGGLPTPGTITPSGGASGPQGAVSSASVGSSASRLPASVPPLNRNGQVQSGAFIITSEATRNGEVASEELSLEIIRYLSQNNPDLEVLRQIKENGMLYKFKTVENGVERQREVFIQFERLSPEARRIVETQIESQRVQSPILPPLEEQIATTRRSYSYEALKLIVGQEILRERR